MPQEHIITSIKRLDRQIFTTREIAFLRGTSLSSATQTLNGLAKSGVLLKICRGTWGLEFGKEKISQYTLIQFLPPAGRVYLSFTSALHLYGIIEQIPRIITVATRAHSTTIRTSLGTYRLHSICRELFDGFDWYKGKGGFLIASPEKALIDCIYIAGRKGNAFASFPELHLDDFNVREAQRWIDRIPNARLKNRARNAFESLIK